MSALDIRCGWRHTIIVPGRGTNLIGWGHGPDGELSHKKGFTEFGAHVLNLPDSWYGSSQGRPQADVGRNHTAIILDQKLYTLGARKNGLLGHDNGKSGRVEFDTPGPVQCVACGAGYTVAVVGEDAKQLYGWGIGVAGNLGNGEKVNRYRPFPFRILDVRTSEPKAIESVSCGTEHSIALTCDGQVYSWGRGSNGRLGHGNSKQCSRPQLIEDLVVSAQERITQIVAGDAHSMALNAEGRVYTWGMGSHGRLGLGNTQDVYSPRIIPALVSKTVTDIDCHTSHSLAVVAAAGTQPTLYTWGGGNNGKLGHKKGSEANSLTPKPVPFFGKRLREAVIRASCGVDHTVCVTKTGKVFAWGVSTNKRCGVDGVANFDSILSDAKERFFDLPVRIPGLDEKRIVGFQEGHDTGGEQYAYHVRQVCSGDKHTVVRVGKFIDNDEDGKLEKGQTADGELIVFGSNEYGQLGTGPHKSSYKPIKVPIGGDPASPVYSITAQNSIMHVCCGSFHTVACSVAGNVFTWGRNSHGQLGLGDLKDRNRPCLVELLQGEDIRSVEAGGRSTAAVPKQPRPSEKRFPFLFLWGDASSGQLGMGETARNNVLTPKQLQIKVPEVYVGSGDNSCPGIEIALGERHTVLLTHHLDAKGRRRSDVWTTGEGKSGKLGLGSYADEWEFRKVAFSRQDDDALAGPGGAGSSQGPSTDRKGFATTRAFRVVAGATCTMCVMESSLSDAAGGASHSIFVWGRVPGIFNYDVNSPKRLDLDLAKILVLPSYFGAGFEYQVCDLSIGENHTLIAIQCDGQHEVIAYGSPRFGKLGIGNVASFTEVNQKPDAEGNESSDRAKKPLAVSELSRKGISLVATKADHSIAASSSKGTVWTWGHAGNGRLGLGDLDSKRIETLPRLIQMFDHDGGDMSDSDFESHARLDQANGNETDVAAETVRGSADMAAVNASGRPGKENVQTLQARLQEINNTVDIAHAIEDVYSTYEKKMREYAEVFQRYADQHYLTRKVIFGRMSQHHMTLNPKKYEHKLESISYQPLPQLDPNTTRARNQEERKGELALESKTRLNPYELNPLELYVARMHMDPNMVYQQIYLPEKKRWVERGDTPDTREEKRALVQLLTGVYELDSRGPRDRFLILLRLIMHNHAETCKSSKAFLAINTFEWMLFCDCLKTGGMIIRLRSAFNPIYLSMKNTELQGSMTPWEVLNSRKSTRKRVEMAMRSFCNMANVMIRRITAEFVEPLMDYCLDYALVLHEVLEGTAHFHMLGEYLVQAIVQVVLDSSYAMRDNPDRKCIEIGAMRMILYSLQRCYGLNSDDRERKSRGKAGEPELVRIANQYLFNALKNKDLKRELKESNGFGMLWQKLAGWNSAKNRFIPSPFTVFSDYLGAIRAQTADGKDYKRKDYKRKDKDYKRAVGSQNRRRILTQFLKERSTMHHNTLQISLQAVHRYLWPRLEASQRFWRCVLENELNGIVDGGRDAVERLCDTRGGRERWRDIPKGACMNVRFDLFMADREARLQLNRACGNIWSPSVAKSSSERQAVDADKKRHAATSIERVIEVSEKECVQLWFTMKQPQYQKIVAEYGRMEAWVNIVKTLNKEREIAMADSESKLVIGQLEWCRRLIRKFVHNTGKKTVIKIGVCTTRIARGSESDDIEEIPQTALDPSTLFERICTIDQKCQNDNRILRQNLSILNEVIGYVEKKILTVKDDTREVVKIFRHLATASKDQKQDSLHQFFDHWHGERDLSKIRNYKSVHVSRPRGSMLEMRYEDMLEDDLIKPVRIQEAKGWAKIDRGSFGVCGLFGSASPQQRSLQAFISGLSFLFHTSKYPDVIHVSISYTPKKTMAQTVMSHVMSRVCRTMEPQSNLSVIATLDLKLRDGAAEIIDVSGQVLRKSRIVAEYDPLGEPVPVRQRVEIELEPQSLYEFLTGPKFHRPNQVFDIERMLSSSGLLNRLLEVQRK